MISKNILVIIGHPARERESFSEALAYAYKEGAEQAGHHVEILKIANLEFDPILHEGYKKDQFKEFDLMEAQEKLIAADHWVIIYPLWQFMMPALLKGFFERMLTKGFAYDFKGNRPVPGRALKGKSARLIQTMAMPNFLYRWFAREHGAKALKSMLTFCGIHPINIHYFGMAESMNSARAQRYLKAAHQIGQSEKLIMDFVAELG